jgi:glycine C-acetyltransferase
MYGAFKSYLEKELKEIKQSGLYKTERIITSPQQAEISVNKGQKCLIFAPTTIWACLPTPGG